MYQGVITVYALDLIQSLLGGTLFAGRVPMGQFDVFLENLRQQDTIFEMSNIDVSTVPARAHMEQTFPAY